MTAPDGHPATEPWINIQDLPEPAIWQVLNPIADIVLECNTELAVLGIDRWDNVVVCYGSCRFTHPCAAIILSDVSMIILGVYGCTDRGYVRTRDDGRSVHIFAGPRV